MAENRINPGNQGRTGGQGGNPGGGNQGRPGGQGPGNGGTGLMERAQDAVTGAVSGATEQVQEWAGNVADTAREWAGNVSQGAERAYSTTRDAVTGYEQSFESTNKKEEKSSDDIHDANQLMVGRHDPLADIGFAQASLAYYADALIDSPCCHGQFLRYPDPYRRDTGLPIYCRLSRYAISWVI